MHCEKFDEWTFDNKPPREMLYCEEREVSHGPSA